MFQAFICLTIDSDSLYQIDCDEYQIDCDEGSWQSSCLENCLLEQACFQEIHDAEDAPC